MRKTDTRQRDQPVQRPWGRLVLCVFKNKSRVLTGGRAKPERAREVGDKGSEGKTVNIKGFI